MMVLLLILKTARCCDPFSPARTITFGRQLGGPLSPALCTAQRGLLNIRLYGRYPKLVGFRHLEKLRECWSSVVLRDDSNWRKLN